MKKIIFLMLCTLLFSQLSFASDATEFSDLKDDFWAKESIDFLVEKNVISGYPDGSFRPNENITINEFVVMIIKSMGYQVEATEGDDWVTPYIKKAKEIGLLREDQFLYHGLKFTSDIIRQEMVRIAMDSISITEGLPYPSVINQYIKYDVSDSEQIHPDVFSQIVDAYKLGIVSGYPDGSFKPSKTVTRAEAASVLVGVMNSNVRTPYAGNPYKGIQTDSEEVPIRVYENDSGKNVGFDFIWKREYTSFYTLDRNYDDKGNLTKVYGNGARQYPMRIQYVKMLPPLHKGKPLNEVIELARYLFNNQDNGDNYLETYASLNRSSVSAYGFQSKEFLDQVYTDEGNPTIQSMLVIERIDFIMSFNPYNSYDDRYLNEGMYPFEITIYKKTHLAEEPETYGEYFISTYGEHIKAFLDILFEKESDIVWNQFLKGIDDDVEDADFKSALNNRDYSLRYDNGYLSLRVSLKK